MRILRIPCCFFFNTQRINLFRSLEGAGPWAAAKFIEAAVDCCSSSMLLLLRSQRKVIVRAIVAYLRRTCAYLEAKQQAREEEEAEEKKKKKREAEEEGGGVEFGEANDEGDEGEQGRGGLGGKWDQQVEPWGEECNEHVAVYLARWLGWLLHGGRDYDPVRPSEPSQRVFKVSLSPFIGESLNGWPFRMTSIDCDTLTAYLRSWHSR